MDNLLRNALVASALMAGGGVFYHFVVYLPEVERVKAESAAEERRAKQEEVTAKRAQLEQDKRDAELRESARQATYAACNQEASQNYAANWASACKTALNNRQASYDRCMGSTLGEAFCKSNYPVAAYSENCALPNSQAETVNRYNREAQEKCLSEAKTGLGG